MEVEHMENLISQILYKLRSETKQSQEAVAKAIGVSRVAYTRYENGSRKPETDIAIKLANHFGVSVNYLYGIDDIPVSSDKKNQPAAKGDELDENLINLLVDLSPSEVQRVLDFVSGIKASRKE